MNGFITNIVFIYDFLNGVSRKGFSIKCEHSLHISCLPWWFEFIQVIHENDFTSILFQEGISLSQTIKLIQSTFKQLKKQMIRCTEPGLHWITAVIDVLLANMRPEILLFEQAGCLLMDTLIWDGPQGTNWANFFSLILAKLVWTSWADTSPRMISKMER